LEGRKTSTLPLYRSELLEEWSRDVHVVVAEGEKAAGALAERYPSVVGTVTGAEGTPDAEVLEVLRGRRIVLWPDNDDPGRRHMERVAAALQSIADEVRIFEWEGAPLKGDAADHPVVRTQDSASVGGLLEEMTAAPVREAVPSSFSL
jgi:DNA primase